MVAGKQATAQVIVQKSNVAIGRGGNPDVFFLVNLDGSLLVVEPLLEVIFKSRKSGFDVIQ